MTTIAPTTDTAATIAPSWKQVRAFARASKKLDIVQAEVTEALASEPEARHFTQVADLAAHNCIRVGKRAEAKAEIAGLSAKAIKAAGVEAKAGFTPLEESQAFNIAARFAQGEALVALGVDVRAACDEWFTNKNRNWSLPVKAERFITAARLDTIAPNVTIESEPEAPLVEADGDLDEMTERLRALGLSDAAIAAAMFVQG